MKSTTELILLLLLIFLSSINCELNQPLFKCHHDNNLDRNPLPNVVAKLSSKQKEEQRRRIQAETDSDGFRALNIYLDLENIKYGITQNGLEAHQEVIISSMEKAVNTLKTLLKVKPLQEAYALTDANFGELGIEKWNTELFGDEANKKENNDLKSLGIDLVIFGKFEDLVDTTLATANSMAYQRTEVNKGEPYIGVVRINKNIDFSKPNTKEFFQTVLVHEFTHILGFSKNFFETYYNNIFTKNFC